MIRKFMELYFKKYYVGIFQVKMIKDVQKYLASKNVEKYYPPK